MIAKEEFLDTIKPKNKIKCAYIYFRPPEYPDLKRTSILKENYTNKEYKEFLNSLDYEYDSGYGVQELYGTVWMTDGTWYERKEYDGLEEWIHKKCPKIPEDCGR